MQRRGEFRVSVTKDYLVFASAHFITFAGHRCEGLHGHNYRARVTVEGALDEESWFVFDFVELKRIMRGLCDEIDHLVLLPLQNPKHPGGRRRASRSRWRTMEAALRVSASATARCCRSRTRPWRCWRSCWPAGFEAELEKRGAHGLTAIEMEVEENFGQSAVYRVTLVVTARRAGDATSRLPQPPSCSAVATSAPSQPASASRVQIVGSAHAAAGQQRHVGHRIAHARDQLEVGAGARADARQVEHDQRRRRQSRSARRDVSDVVRRQRGCRLASSARRRAGQG